MGAGTPCAISFVPICTPYPLNELTTIGSRRNTGAGSISRSLGESSSSCRFLRITRTNERHRQKQQQKQKHIGSTEDVP